MREIKSNADFGGCIYVTEFYATAGDVRLIVDGWSPDAWADIHLDVRARRELIEALTATLPTESDIVTRPSLTKDEYLEEYRQWRRDMGIPVPGDES